MIGTSDAGSVGPAGDPRGDRPDGAASVCGATERRPHLLLVDGDQEICSLMKRFMEMNGFKVTAVSNAYQAKQCWANGLFQIIVLEFKIEGASDFDLFRWFREQENVPVVMIGTMADEVERILGLELGADDFVAKPFNPRELLARILAVLRRAKDMPHEAGGMGAWPKAVRFAGWTVDPSRRRLLDQTGVEVPLTEGEYDLLRVLMERPNRVMSRDSLLDLLHGRPASPFDRSIDVAIGRLRRKLGDSRSDKSIIRTVRGMGYIFAAAVERQ